MWLNYNCYINMISALIGIIVIVSFIIYVKWSQTYWKRRNIMQIRPINMIGMSKLNSSSSFTEAILESYVYFKSLGQKHGGIYFFTNPIYVPVDPDIIKHILQKDFSHFTDHGIYHHPKDVLTMHIFNLEGESWKQLRAKLTPTFSSGKIKMMFETLVEKTIGLQKQLSKYAGKKSGMAIKDILERFTTDVIASCGFGIECNSLEEPDNLFRKYGKEIFEVNLRNNLRFFINYIIPSTILANLGYRFHGTKTTKFYTDVVRKTIKTRETYKIQKNDFMHLLLQLKNKGTISDSTELRSVSVKDELTISEEEIIAQCFVFFLAGFETSSTTMTFALLEIAQHPEIQDKLRQEIIAVLKKYNKITYDAVMEMTYLEKVINETLRKYPPVPYLPRKCTKTYKVPGTNLVLEKETRILVPVWGLHTDAEYFPNPEVFNPENFSEENKSRRPDMTFIPFGEGPRMCMGSRFGMLETKVGLITILRNFKISLNRKTAIPIKMDKTIVLSVKGDVWIDIERI